MSSLLEVPTAVALTRYWKPLGAASESPGMCQAGGCGSTMGRWVMKSCPFVAIIMGESISMDQSWVYFFMLVAPPLHSGVVGPYMVRGDFGNSVHIKIVSDRGTQFTSRFWEKQHEAMDTKLNFSLTYHPQTERVNQILEDMLRVCNSAYVVLT
jgi:hypothetical protein